MCGTIDGCRLAMESFGPAHANSKRSCEKIKTLYSMYGASTPFVSLNQVRNTAIGGFAMTVRRPNDEPLKLCYTSTLYLLFERPERQEDVSLSTPFGLRTRCTCDTSGKSLDIYIGEIV